MGTSRTISCLVQSVVPVIGLFCILSNERNDADRFDGPSAVAGPSTRIQAPAQPCTSLLFVHTASLRRLPLCSPASNIFINVAKPPASPDLERMQPHLVPLRSMLSS